MALHIITKHSSTNHVGAGRIPRMRDFLRDHPVGVLSTVSPNGDPHGTVIYFGVDNDLNITFLTRSGTKKFDNLKHHNHVMLTVFEAKSQTTLQLSGRAKQITEADEINAVADQALHASLKTSNVGMPAIAKLDAGDFVALRIQPVQARMAIFGRTSGGEYGDVFESVESFELTDSHE